MVRLIPLSFGLSSLRADSGIVLLKSRPRYEIIDLILFQMLPWNRAIYHTNLTASHPPAKRWLGTNKRYATFQHSLPHFMLRQILSPNSGADVSQFYNSSDVMTVTNFNLFPGGVSRESLSQDASLNERFSETVLESMKLLLNASLVRKKSQARAGEVGADQSEQTETQRLMDIIDEARKSDGIKMGGVFPQLIAQKSTPL